ncbi:MAG: hypothetical protein OMM_03572 [Candidatus Magnetoglobus multicellularis str. Araruama]|uniref:Uncharacterized protein n=1 Tax=Candidatus Magnetoglobus multicellularis str. Araruama TaxID=890399 RepID=A0A1V1P5F5_9BACT|nr:MAG: hypothetical protein OMM_03572 [Candidatus Magnetoglobus multicellularis str. Araruama]
MHLEEKVLSNHSDIIRGLSWSPDGNYLAVGGYDEILTVWDVDDEDDIYVYQDLSGWITRSVWSPNGQYIACSSYQSGEIKILNSDNGEEHTSISGHERGCMCLKWLSGNQIIASGGHDYKVKLWDIQSGNEILDLNCPDQVNHLISIPNSNSLFALLPGFKTVLFDPTDPESIKRALALKVRCPINPQNLLSPDGQYFLCLLNWEVLVVLDIYSGNAIKEIVCPNGKWESFSWSPDGKKLVAAGIDLYFYDTTTWDEIFRIKQPEHRDSFISTIEYCFWSKDSSMIFTSTHYDDLVNVWESETGKKLFSWRSGGKFRQGEYAIEDMAVHPIKNCIAFGDNKGNVFVLDILTG